MLTFFWLIRSYLEIDYVLQLWLPQVPPHTGNFCRIIIIAYLANLLSIGYKTAVYAYGKIGGFQITVGGLSILTLPLVLVGLLLGWKVEYALLMHIVTSAGMSLGRVFWIKKLMHVPVSRWIDSVLLKSTYAFFPSLVVGLLLDSMLVPSVQRLFLIITICGLCTGLSSWGLALNKEEKEFIIKKIQKIISLLKK